MTRAAALMFIVRSKEKDGIAFHPGVNLIKRLQV